MSMTETQSTATNVAKYVQRREKFLACDIHTLSHYDVTVLIQHCYKNSEGIVENLLLASLFCGRHIREICVPDTRVKYVENADFGLLLSDIRFPAWSQGDPEDLYRNQSPLPPYSLLPLQQIKAIELAASMSDCNFIV